MDQGKKKLEELAEAFDSVAKNMMGSKENPTNSRMLGGNNIRYSFNLPGRGNFSFSAPEDLTPEELEKTKQYCLDNINEVSKFRALPIEEQQKYYLRKCTSKLRELYDAAKLDITDMGKVEDLMKNKDYMELRDKVLSVEMLLLEIPSEYKEYFRGIDG